MGSTIEFKRPDGQTAPGYLSEPASSAGAPGIVLLQEWWGLDNHIKETADRLTREGGFRVLSPDLYRGRVAAKGDEANHLMEGLDFADAATQDVRGAALYLKSTGSPKVGVTGFCMGGALTILAAMYAGDLDAAVAWYGLPPAEAGDPSKIRIPLQAHWAEHDEHFPIGAVEVLEARLKAGNVAYEGHRYDAKHAFYNPGGLGNHHPEHAGTAWARTLDFFKRNLN